MTTTQLFFSLTKELEDQPTLPPLLLKLVALLLPLLLLQAPLLVPEELLFNNKEPLSFNIRDIFHQELHTQCHNNITNHQSSNKLLLLQWVQELSKSHLISELSLSS
jgi:hypothetical protein